MKISKETIDVLRNYSTIQPNLVFKGGNKVSTIAEAKNIMATTEVAEEFPSNIGIYDLNEFLSALSLIEDPEFDFGEDSVKVSSSIEGSSLTYRYADVDMLTTSDRDINMPTSDVEVLLTAEDISQLRKAGGALGHTIAAIVSHEGENDIYLEVKDPSNPSANVYSRHLGENDGGSNFDIQFLISNLKLTPDDYSVSISSKLISHWKPCNLKSEYWIALEKDSNYSA